MNYLLAIDLGTSSARAMIYTLQGALITSSQFTVRSYYPKPGWVEQDPEELWQKTLLAIRDVVSQVDSKHIVSCGITNQRETTLIWNKDTGVCLAPAIVWQDRRTEVYCQSLLEFEECIQEKTGLFPTPYFSASKLYWLLQNHSEATALALKGKLAFGTVDSYLIWRLTKGKKHVTDSTNASRTMLFNIKNETWDTDLLKLFNIPESILPIVCSSDAHFGSIDQEWLGFELPITGVAGDQQAALIGQNCFESGMVKATFGTGGFLLLNTGATKVHSENKLLTTIAYKIQNKLIYALEGSIYHAGTTIKWLRDELQLIASADETAELANSLQDNGGVYFISSFTGLGAPYWLPSQGASYVGLSLTTKKAHFVRAALEGVAYQTRDILSSMQKDSKSRLTVLRVDGGMANNHWFLQFLADQLRVRIEKPVDVEASARGVAMLAALGCGVYNSLSALKHSGFVESFEPTKTVDVVEAEYAGWQNAVNHI